MSVNRYRSYGLEIDSELLLPELLPGGEGQPDVHIRFGPVPTALPDFRSGGSYYQAAPDTLLLVAGQVARYLVLGGREIVIDPLPGLATRCCASTCSDRHSVPCFTSGGFSSCMPAR